jgi:hypothetical protein
MGDAPKRKGRLPKAKSQPPKDTQVADELDDGSLNTLSSSYSLLPGIPEDDRRKDESLRPAPKLRGGPPKAKQPSQQSKADVLGMSVIFMYLQNSHRLQSDDTTRIQEAPTKPKKVVKKRRRAADSDQEDGGTSDYIASRKRAKADKAAPAKSAATTTRKRKAVQVTQPDDSDDSSAIVIVAKKKAIKVGSSTEPFFYVFCHAVYSVFSSQVGRLNQAACLQGRPWRFSRDEAQSTTRGKASNPGKKSLC